MERHRFRPAWNGGERMERWRRDKVVTNGEWWSSGDGMVVTLVVILVEMGRFWKCSVTMQEGADYDARGLATPLAK